MDKTQKKLLVRESNNLIEAKYKLDLWEARIFLSALSQIRPADEDFKKYKIYVNDIITEHNITTKAAHGLLKKAAQTLRKKEITIPYEYEGEMLQLTTGLITSYGTKEDADWEDDDGAYVVVDLHPDLKPYLLQLKAQFTQYNISFLMQMQSGHSRRIYRLLKQYLKIGKRKISIQKLREILCIEKGEYKKYSHFKQRVIQKAQKDLATCTDITFEFEEIKRGRKVKEILFLIRGKDLGILDIGIEEKDKVTLEPIIPLQFTKLLEWGISPSMVEKYLIDYKEEQLMERMEYLKSLEGTDVGNKIKNWAGYFLKLMEQGDFVAPQKVAQQQKASNKAKKAATANQKHKLAQAIDKLKKSKTATINATVQQLFEENDGLKSKVVGLVKRRKYSGYDKKMGTEENLTQNPMFRGAVQAELLKRYPDPFVAIDQEYTLKMKRLQHQLENLT